MLVPANDVTVLLVQRSERPQDCDEPVRPPVVILNFAIVGEDNSERDLCIGRDSLSRLPVETALGRICLVMNHVQASSATLK